MVHIIICILTLAPVEIWCKIYHKLMTERFETRSFADLFVARATSVLLKVFPGAAVVFLLAQASPAGERLGQPNVLLVSVCSIRPDHMSCYGYERGTTPNLNKFINEAIVFENAITQWPKTTQALAAIMTGKYCHTNGVMRTPKGAFLDEEHDTLAEILSRQGCRTGAFISTGALGRKTNILQGFEVAEETFRLPFEQRFATVTNRAVEWIRQQQTSDPQEPFFAWVHYNNAHQPYRAPGAPPGLFIADKFYNPAKKVRVNRDSLSLQLPSHHPCPSEALRPDIGGAHPRSVLKESKYSFDYYIACYDAGIYSADSDIGDLLRAVGDMKLLENTITVLVGDHGESLGDHNYYFGHGRFPYQACACVPLIIRPAGGTERVRVDNPVGTFGLAPTLLEMVGIEIPKEMEASSLLPIAYGEDDGGYVFMESGYHMNYTISVRDGKWKLIHVPNEIDRSLMKGTEYELYNLEEDPGELNNLVAAELGLRDRLKQVLKNWSEPWVNATYSGASMKRIEVDEETIEQLRSLGYVK